MSTFVFFYPSQIILLFTNSNRCDFEYKNATKTFILQGLHYRCSFSDCLHQATSVVSIGKKIPMWNVYLAKGELESQSYCSEK